MSSWKSLKAKRVRSALERVRWRIKRQKGSHKTLERVGFPDYVFSFHDSEEIGSKMMARIAKKTGLKPEDI